MEAHNDDSKAEYLCVCHDTINNSCTKLITCCMHASTHI